jgi:hypothetical protein
MFRWFAFFFAVVGLQAQVVVLTHGTVIDGTVMSARRQT